MIRYFPGQTTYDHTIYSPFPAEGQNPFDAFRQYFATKAASGELSGTRYAQNLGGRAPPSRRLGFPLTPPREIIGGCTTEERPSTIDSSAGTRSKPKQPRLDSKGHESDVERHQLDHRANEDQRFLNKNDDSAAVRLEYNQQPA